MFCLCRFAHLGESQHPVDRTEYINLANIICLWVKHVTLQVFPNSVIPLTCVDKNCVDILVCYNPTFFILKSHLAFAVALGQMCLAAHTKCSQGRHLAVRRWILNLLDPNPLSLHQLTFLLTTAMNQPLQDMCLFPRLHSILTITWSGNVQPPRSISSIILSFSLSFLLWVSETSVISILL